MSDITEIIDSVEFLAKSAAEYSLDAVTLYPADVLAIIAAYREQSAELATLRDQIKRAEEQEPVTHQFQTSDGAWNNFIDQRHYENTVADGRWPIRALYTKEPK